MRRGCVFIVEKRNEFLIPRIRRAIWRVAVPVGIAAILAPIGAVTQMQSQYVLTAARSAGHPYVSSALAVDVLPQSVFTPTVTLYNQQGLAVAQEIEILSAPSPRVLAAPPVAPAPPTPPPAPPSPPAATTVSVVTYGQRGVISWYGSPAGTCASPYLPFGTVVTVTNFGNGLSTHCVVNDRGPYVTGRILDLSPATFSQIAPLGQGLFSGGISWA